MDATPDPELKSELESFRNEWISEVRAKHPARDAAAAGPARGAEPATTSGPKSPKVAGTKPIPRHLDDDHDYVQPLPFEDTASSVPPTTHHEDHGETRKGKGREPESALDHYEAAVAKESQGSLGDSLRLYRKAFRMDDHVDKKYREKYFPKAGPPSASKPQRPNPSNASPTIPNTAHHSSAAGGSEAQVQDTSNLIASFAGLSIAPAPPIIEGTPAPPCPIAGIPGEVLSHVFRDVALTDVRDFARLAQVCKRFAYVVCTDFSIWRRLCEGREFGWRGMQHEFTHGIKWEPVPQEVVRLGDQVFREDGTLVATKELWREQITRALLEKTYNGSWRAMFRGRPRIRFGGAYISTVNYWRSGQAGPNQTTWGSPMHVVTYYRYLRFFRDGTVMSLQSTHPPSEVIPHFNRENYHVHAGGKAPYLPGSVIAGTYRGVWKVGCSWDEYRAEDEEEEEETNATKEGDVAAAEEAEANVYIETEGVRQYTFEMELVMRSAGRAKGLGTRNNKLVWRSFYSLDRMTGAKAEFPSKNDKPFFFSRVASYGVGE